MGQCLLLFCPDSHDCHLGGFMAEWLIDIGLGGLVAKKSRCDLPFAKPPGPANRHPLSC